MINPHSKANNSSGSYWWTSGKELMELVNEGKISIEKDISFIAFYQAITDDTLPEEYNPKENPFMVFVNELMFSLKDKMPEEDVVYNEFIEPSDIVRHRMVKDAFFDKIYKRKQIREDLLNFIDTL